MPVISLGRPEASSAPSAIINTRSFSSCCQITLPRWDRKLHRPTPKHRILLSLATAPEQPVSVCHASRVHDLHACPVLHLPRIVSAALKYLLLLLTSRSKPTHRPSRSQKEFRRTHNSVEIFTLSSALYHFLCDSLLKMGSTLS